MTVCLTKERVEDIINLCNCLVLTKCTTIRKFSCLIGKLVAAIPGVEYASLHIKPLEKAKDAALKTKRGNFDSYMTVQSNIRDTLQWWISHLPSAFKVVSHGQPSIVIYTDSSLEGWGAYDKTSKIKTSGLWSADKQKLHINLLELKACQLALQSLCKEVTNTHVRVYMDNTTSCAYIQKLGGKSGTLDELARSIWFWCIERNIHLSAAHVAGKENVEADELSRKHNDDLEWSIKESVFAKI
jgi:hypothetical protein